MPRIKKATLTVNVDIVFKWGIESRFGKKKYGPA